MFPISIFLGEGSFPVSCGRFKGISEAWKYSGHHGENFDLYFNSGCYYRIYTFFSLKVRNTSHILHPWLQQINLQRSVRRAVYDSCTSHRSWWKLSRHKRKGYGLRKGKRFYIEINLHNLCVDIQGLTGSGESKLTKTYFATKRIFLTLLLSEIVTE